MNTIDGKILWRTFLPVLLLLFLVVSCKQSEQHSSWKKRIRLFLSFGYRFSDHSSTTDTCVGKAKDGGVN